MRLFSDMSIFSPEETLNNVKVSESVLLVYNTVFELLGTIEHPASCSFAVEQIRSERRKMRNQGLACFPHFILATS